MTRAEAESGMVVISEIAQTMAEHRRVHLPLAKTQPEVVLQLEANAYSCGNFGGCHYQDRCKLTKKEKRRSIMAQSEKKLSLKEKMAARKAKRAAEGGDAPAAAPASDEAPSSAAPPAGAPAINPPEQPSPEEQAAPLSQDEAAANAGGAAADPKPKPKPRGRPKGSTGKKAEVVEFGHDQAFVGIFAAAVTGGEPRHMTAAEQAWAKYRSEFMADG